MANTHSLDLELSSSQYASITDVAQTGLDITGDISLEAWIKIEQLPSVAGTAFLISGKWTSDTGKRGYRFRITTTDTLEFAWSGEGPTENTLTSNAAIVDAGSVGKWVHVAVTFTAATPTGVLYKNAASVASTVSGTQTSINNNAEPYAIGATNITGTPASFFDGLMDEVRVWNDVRTGAEILSNYLAELVGSESNLVAYHKLNNDYLDETSNNNDLTASGSPAFTSDVPFPTANKNHAFFM